MPDEWMARGACRGQDPDLFFPYVYKSGGGRRPEGLRGPTPDETYSLSVCGRCSVTEPCLEYALTNHIDDGVWGGMIPSQRRRLVRQRSRPSVDL